MTRVRGIRGATTVEENTPKAVLAATRELLERLVAANDIAAEDVVCALFTTTRDINAEFPAVAARQMGWTNGAFLCGHEMEVPDSLRGCIRILILVNTERSAQEIVHVYLRDAVNLRSRGTTEGVL